MNARIQPDRSATPDLRTEDDFSLPGWTYWDPEFFELERQVIFRKSWHLVCHVNDVPKSGDFLTFKFLNESDPDRPRGRTAVVRSFHNVCRHRAARLVGAEQGNCGKRITCPYHAWTYATDGRLVGVPLRAGYPGMNPNDYGLAEVEQEIWRGFVFVRFAPGLPSVADQMAPYAEELAGAPLEDLVPLGPPRAQTRHVNWKNVADNYSDGLHIPVAHPGLSRVFGKSYAIEAREWVDKMSGELVDQPSSAPPSGCTRSSSRHGPRRGTRPGPTTSSGRTRRIELYPDQIDFMQFIPVTPTETDAPLHQLRAAGRPARDEGRALPQLAHQPAREPRGQGPDRARAGRHGLLELYGRPARRRRGVPAQLRPAHARAVPGGARGFAAAERVEHQPQGAAAPVSSAARKPRYERQVASDRREALVDATIESLKRHGYEGLSVRRIAAEAGVSIGLINHHFPNKDTLVAESYRTFSRRLAANFEKAVAAAGPDPRTRLRAYFDAFFSGPNLDPQVLTAWVVYWSLVQVSPEMRAVRDEEGQGYSEVLGRLLSDLARDARRRARGPRARGQRAHRAPRRAVAAALPRSHERPPEGRSRALRRLGRPRDRA